MESTFIPRASHNPTLAFVSRYPRNTKFLAPVASLSVSPFKYSTFKIGCVS